MFTRWWKSVGAAGLAQRTSRHKCEASRRGNGGNDHRHATTAALHTQRGAAGRKVTANQGGRNGPATPVTATTHTQCAVRNSGRVGRAALTPNARRAPGACAGNDADARVTGAQKASAAPATATVACNRHLYAHTNTCSGAHTHLYRSVRPCQRCCACRLLTRCSAGSKTKCRRNAGGFCEDAPSIPARRCVKFGALSRGRFARAHAKDTCCRIARNTIRWRVTVDRSLVQPTGAPGVISTSVSAIITAARVDLFTGLWCPDH